MTVFIHQQQSSKTEVYLYENVILFKLSVLYYTVKLHTVNKGELLSMSDTMFILLTLGLSPVLSGDRTNEPVLWQQMCPDRYKQSQLWVLQANPRG